MELKWFERCRCYLITIAIVLFDLITYQYFKNLLIDKLGFTVSAVISSLLGLITLITAILYIYNVYIVNIGGSSSNSHSNSNSKKLKCPEKTEKIIKSEKSPRFDIDNESPTCRRKLVGDSQ